MRNIFLYCLYILNKNKMSLCGLENIGNSCYMNTVLQILLHTPLFTNYFKSKLYLEDVNKNAKHESFVVNELLNLLVATSPESGIKVFNPRGIKETVGIIEQEFAGFRQQDSNEFFIKFIEIIHRAVMYNINVTHKGIPKTKEDQYAIDAINTWRTYFEKKYSYIVDLFYGQIRSFRECRACGDELNTFDPYGCLILSMAKGENTLEELLDTYTKEEHLADRKCDKCKHEGTSVKKISIWNTPKILCIQLNRFEIPGQKNCNVINFGLELDLAKYSSDYTNSRRKNLYKLYGICCHNGGGVDSGHYYALCDNGEGEWFKYDDESVTSCGKHINIREAYVLFYKLDMNN